MFDAEKKRCDKLTETGGNKAWRHWVAFSVVYGCRCSFRTIFCSFFYHRSVFLRWNLFNSCGINSSGTERMNEQIPNAFLNWWSAQCVLCVFCQRHRLIPFFFFHSLLSLPNETDDDTPNIQHNEIVCMCKCGIVPIDMIQPNAFAYARSSITSESQF